MSPSLSRSERTSPPPQAGKPSLAKFEVHGEEMLEKAVTQSGRSGRVYLPHDWIGKRVKIVLTGR